MINITKPAAKARIQRMLLRQMSILERGFAKNVRISLNGATREAAALVEQGTSDGMDILLDQWIPDLIESFWIGYRRSGSVFSKLVFDAVSRLKFTKPVETKAMGDEFWNAFRLFIGSQTASRVVRVNRTTKKWIARKIRQGTEEGKSPGEIAKDLRKSGQFNKKRAARIARTEVHMVSNFATQTAIKSTRLEMNKEWVAFIDDRTRTDHIKMNGKRVHMDKDFLVGGMLMAYPGDPRGGAKNVIHCRCVLLYHVIRSRYKII